MKKNYGFIRLDRIDKKFTGNQLDVSHMDFATTGEFDHLAKNHCGAVMLTNVALYYKLPYPKEVLFSKIHEKTGNGPVIFIQGRAKRSFASLGYEVDTRRVINQEDIIITINLKIPQGFLVAKDPLSMHWIFVVGYRIYESNIFYLVHDGWNRRNLKLYSPKIGAKLLCAVSFRIKNN